MVHGEVPEAGIVEVEVDTAVTAAATGEDPHQEGGEVEEEIMVTVTSVEEVCPGVEEAVSVAAEEEMDLLEEVEAETWMVLPGEVVTVMAVGQ